MLACSTLNNSSRKQQIESWESSDTNKEVVMPRPAERVKFPIDVQFHAACSNSELDEVKDLLSKGVDINVANADGLTVLHQACIDNNYEVAQFLLSNGANVNVQDNEGWTPLHACASCSYTELANDLIFQTSSSLDLWLLELQFSNLSAYPSRLPVCRSLWCFQPIDLVLLENNLTYLPANRLHCDLSTVPYSPNPLTRHVKIVLWRNSIQSKFPSCLNIQEPHMTPAGRYLYTQLPDFSPANQERETLLCPRVTPTIESDTFTTEFTPNLLVFVLSPPALPASVCGVVVVPSLSPLPAFLLAFSHSLSLSVCAHVAALRRPISEARAPAPRIDSNVRACVRACSRPEIGSIQKRRLIDARLLLDKGADASIVSFELELPLDVAQGADMVSLLKDWMQNHSIDEKAARSAEEQLMLRDAREWLASGDYPNVVDPRTGATALHIAAAKGYSEVLELLLKLPDVEVDATDVDGWTPLHAAAHWAKEKPLRLLAAAGASFDAITLTNQSIYDVADRSITMLLRQLREAHRNDQQRAADEKSSTVATRGKPDEEERPEMTKEEAGGGGEGEDENATPAAPKLAKMEEKAEEAVEEATRKELPRAAKEKPEGGRPHTPPKPSSPPPAIKAEDEREDEEEEEDEVEETAVKPESEEPTVSTDLPEKAKEVEKEETVKPMEASKKPERESPPPRQTPTKPAELSPARSPPPPSPPPASVTSPSPTSSIAAAPGKPEQVSDHSSAPPSPPLAANPENTATAVDTSTTPASAPSRRISAVLAPARSEETEAQRSSKARLVRSTRRSTQGISTDVLEEARRLSAGVGAATSASTPNAPSPTPAPVQVSPAGEGFVVPRRGHLLSVRLSLTSSHPPLTPPIPHVIDFPFCVDLRSMGHRPLSLDASTHPPAVLTLFLLPGTKRGSLNRPITAGLVVVSRPILPSGTSTWLASVLVLIGLTWRVTPPTRTFTSKFTLGRLTQQPNHWLTFESTPEKASRGAIPPPPTSPKLSITVQTSVRPLSKAVREAAGGSDVDDAEAKPATHVSKATILPTQPSSSSSTDTTNSTADSTASIIAHSRARRAARDRVPTGRLNSSDVLAAAKQLEQNANSATDGNSATDSSSASTIPRPTTRLLLRSTILNTTPASPAAAATVNNGGCEHQRPSPVSLQFSPSPSAGTASSRSAQPAASVSSKPDHRYNWRDNLDYRRLYEEERSEKERLKRTLDQVTRDVNALRSELARLHTSPNHSASLNARISAGGGDHSLQSQRRPVDFFEDQAKEIDRLRQENARMADENKSLIRVISKLSARTTS
ncbi:unnamed protein product [Mesocestoides corti]|uniref:cGMP-dependent protein kinase interacting domain-containing protein n=1 Tax=Mesocestoides corti TaxID=53468 RepID=A0A158QVV2_MESCO|nr:unnamed protein product [Mesocestoides corti]